MATSTTGVTLVAVFSRISTAQSAANELVLNGFSIGDIRIRSGETAAVAKEADLAEQHPTHFQKGLKAWFKALFGSAGNREANTILALDTTQQDAARAAYVLNRYPPINVFGVRPAFERPN
jgi:hypothetical protein